VALSDEAYMGRALRLAERGRGRVSPNPLVGAVVVRDGEIVGEGAHRCFGQDHAEVEALSQAGSAAAGSTLFVTLEPCAHHGHTPPCTEAVLSAGAERLVCAVEDPDPRVSGRGLQQLRAAGVAVEVGVGAARAERQNAAFLKHRRTGTPLVELKLGQSLDGRIATRTGASQWITGEAAQRHTHRRRACVDAIAVGAGTVLSDDPQLSVRHVRGRNPRPLVIDGRLRVSPEARVFGGERPILVTSAASPAASRQAFADRGVEVWTFPDEDGRLDLRDVMRAAGERDITSLLIEGGGGLAASALRDRIVDRVNIYVAPLIIGRGVSGIGDLGIDALDEAVQLEEVATRRLGPDILYTAGVRYGCSRD